MATDAKFAEFITDQLTEAGKITCRKMFGEYAIYSGVKVVALICDNRLYVKPTAEGRAYIGSVTEDSAYPGAKPSFLIEDQIEDRRWLTELIRITAKALPMPKPKKKAAVKKKVTKKKIPPKKKPAKQKKSRT